MHKTFSLSLAGVIVGAIIVAAFALTQFSQANGPFTSPAITASVSTTTVVGPGSPQIVASSSRSYLHVQRVTAEADVYCNANGDIAASATIASFKIGTTTGNSYEFTLEKNPYDGAVRCYASASTTLIVYELKRG